MSDLSDPLLSPSVLIVEDNADLRETLVEVLTDAGYAAVGAKHGQAALSVLRDGLVPRLILMDLQMPVMDGWGFVAVWRDDPDLAHIPVVVLSANSDRYPLPLGTDGKPLRGLRKPVPMEALLAVLEEYAPPCG